MATLYRETTAEFHCYRRCRSAVVVLRGIISNMKFTDLGYMLWWLVLTSPLALNAQQGATHKRADHVVSPDGKFLFKYPGSLVGCKQDESNRWVPADGCGGYIPVCADYSSDSAGTVACVAYPTNEMKGTNFGAAAFSVNELKNIAGESACLKLKDSPPQAGKTRDETVNGVEFKVTKIESGAAGHLLESYVYRSFHNGTCYELDINIASANIGNYDPGTMKAFDVEKVERSLKAVLASFKFLK